MRETVVVLPPDMAGEQVVERGDRSTPWDLPGRLQPLCVLGDHRVDNRDERFVRVEQTMPTGQEVTLQPSLAEVLAQNFHHPAVAGQVLVSRKHLCLPDSVCRLDT